MESDYIFHEGNTFSLDGVGDDGGGTSFAFSCRVQGGEDLFEIMAVDLQGVPAKSFPLCRDIQHVFYFFGLCVVLKTVDIGEGDQVIQVIVEAVAAASQISPSLISPSPIIQ